MKKSKMILRDVRCLLKTRLGVLIGLFLYIPIFTFSYFRNDLTSIFALVAIHFVVGIIAIVISKKPLKFGLCNLIAEILFLVIIGWSTIMPCVILIANAVPNLIGDFGFALVGWSGGLAAVVVPCSFVCWFLCWVRNELYPTEPNL